MNGTDFKKLPLSNGLLRVIAEMGFQQMTPIQAASIKPQLAGRDLVGKSKTGSGKTAAYVIPLLHKIHIPTLKPQALILCPTRELSDQVLNQCEKFARHLKGLKIIALVGGKPYPAQVEALKSGVHLIVGTPGRTLELMRDKKINTGRLRTLILDEADRLLEEGFAEEMNAIIEELPKDRQTIFFSATFPASILELSKAHQKNPLMIEVKEESGSKAQIEQYLYCAEKPEKLKTLMEILKKHPAKCTLIFCRTKALVAEIGEQLQKQMSCQTLHADLPQKERDRTTADFRSGKIKILVATDVAARGLDIDILDLVINVDLPSSVDIYTHRIGRTGRAGRTGVAVSIATEYEAGLVEEIERAQASPLIRR